MNVGSTGQRTRHSSGEKRQTHPDKVRIGVFVFPVRTEQILAYSKIKGGQGGMLSLPVLYAPAYWVKRMGSDRKEIVL